tara:strand:+ start:436 stop:990 length:555 start_codon:yes stop_codon:yes gene_type:complete
MKIFTIAVVALLPFASTASANELMICIGEFALCAASGSEPTGNMIEVDGQEYEEGLAVCPVLRGLSIANRSMIGGTCHAPGGKVWSLFSPLAAYPQAPDWSVKPAVARSFQTNDTPGGGMSNQWSFMCDKQAEPVNGAILANCLGPIGESPWTNGPVGSGEDVFTQAPEGTPNPVGAPAVWEEN